jgi:hypothetical protein
MQSGQPFGTALSPEQAVVKAASALCPPYVMGLPGSRRLQLETEDGALPGATLSLRKERRMFSRSWPLLIESRLDGTGPSESLELRLRRRPFRRPPELQAVGRQAPAEARDWVARFEDAGLLRGADVMTSVQALAVSWRPPEARWDLRLQTLAGAMIGTAPGSSIAVPFEPEDVTGLLEVLRAFRRVATAP